ncbi:SgcJ/EcaC family oxidoreductase [Kitasatospora xanthocidica]|uniref:SgcJ/EcaC family oxidoreductase n=1 Tax=Kitasatospora xanthocidica TaxID=83382 RepID=A0A372ZN41_9ACTN|nr:MULTISPECIES: SgcJ/EcaC family oxidoreductase [Kitasatospora]RGD57266.1 SgcJ/EcaC family oxidoreductase [Kitasatospora xanthocidica]
MSATPPPTAADVAALRAVPELIIAAWARHDADGFASVFTDDATLILPGDVYLTGREQIRAFMAQAFAGPFKGTQVTGEPQSVRPLADDVAVLVTKGGVLAPGDTEVTPERAIRATWVLARQGADWRIASYQNTPVAA